MNARMHATIHRVFLPRHVLFSPPVTHCRVAQCALQMLLAVLHLHCMLRTLGISLQARMHLLSTQGSNLHFFLLLCALCNLLCSLRPA
jgi:hypothetical protein